MQKFLWAVVPAFLAAGGAAAGTASQGAKIYGDPARGREIADRWCTGCHSAGPTADDRIPSLPALAKNMSQSESAIRAFLMRPHQPMPPLELSNQQIEDIITFLHTVPAKTGR